jgi:elongation factor P--(R)-beta-lysine ligase
MTAVSPPPAASPWWTPDVHADRRPWLLARGRIKSAIRRWFEAQGFVEVETGCLQVSPGNEAHLHAFRTDLIGTDLERRPLYLHTSPEFACKKLLAAGETKIFTFAPVFRNRERGTLHAPEFTMLEWYRAGAPYKTLWDDCSAILGLAAAETGRRDWDRGGIHGGHACAVTKSYETITLRRAFAAVGILLEGVSDPTAADRDGFAAAANRIGVRTGPDDSWSDIFARVLTERIEPKLGRRVPTILCEYPAHEAALARPTAQDPDVAERFELYVSGVELANGFGELTDAAEQRRRFEAEMALKARRYGERYPIDEDFLSALGAMPAASGCALGFDRLVMLATGAPRVDSVIWTPMPNPGT